MTDSIFDTNDFQYPWWQIYQFEASEGEIIKQSNTNLFVLLNTDFFPVVNLVDNLSFTGLAFD